MPRYWITIVTMNSTDIFHTYTKELPDDRAAREEVGQREGWYERIGPMWKTLQEDYGWMLE